ncbi:MAG: signal recognition particle-docking protein FtsY [Betaproteobacteria bacterium]|nr:signal recognition particle-docking protein FtsY [Betaproteobacteria bacterium]
MRVSFPHSRKVCPVLGRSSTRPTASDSGAPSSPGWLARLRTGLAKTREFLNTDVSTLFAPGSKIDESFFDDLEAALIGADVGVKATSLLIERLRIIARDKRIEDAAALQQEFQRAMAGLLAPLEQPLNIGRKPFVIMVAGVNGAGKTTTIGKLAKYFQSNGKSVLLAAGDTFRAAAREQLKAWGDRNNVAVIAQQGADAGAVMFDSVQAATARGIDVVIADTAGRLPTQLHLMEEIKKVKRVIAKADAAAPDEVLLVLDANTGQNALAQIKSFDAALGLTGLIVTKLDGTAKGGMLAGLAIEREAARQPVIPVRFIGVGEGLDDLRPFCAEEFAAALFAAPA